MKILIRNAQPFLPLTLSSIEQVASAVLAQEGVTTDELSLHFVTTEEISALHATFFNDPTPTDTISFPLDPPGAPGYHVLGEVFVCPETARSYLQKEDPQACYEETLLYLIHGLLHLIGYDDQSEEERIKMRLAEERHLLNLSTQQLSLSKNS